jgi:hypothetical protein
MTGVLSGFRVGQEWRFNGPGASRDVEIGSVDATHAHGKVIRIDRQRLPVDRQHDTSVAIVALATNWHLIKDA